MKRLLITLLLIPLLLSACAGMRNKPAPLAAPANPQALPDITGDYALNGTDMTDAEYGGTLHIESAGESTYALTWLLNENILEGEAHIEGNQLLATWHNLEGTLSGTAAYTITVAGQLDGIRLIDGVTGQNHETCYPNE
ncbi:MAG: hypothetical protein D6755_01420 [Anaerolineae bacterium]|nr:MAG: hypothetical protein D6755_01420 [Anaerolineae bacterium]